MNVASLAVLITFGIGYNNDRVLSDVAMAGLLHDIGLTKLPPSVIAKAHSPASMTFNERDGLYRHPDMAIEILKERGIQISHVAQTIILQHHEEFNGFGYPRGIRGYDVNELSQIIRVADELDQLILQRTAGSLAPQVMALIDRLGRDKIIEPSLADRIRHVLF